MLDDYVPGKVENSNKLEVSDVRKFRAFKYSKYKYQSIKYQKKKATQLIYIQKDNNNCLGFTSQQFNKIYYCGVWKILWKSKKKSNIDSPT